MLKTFRRLLPLALLPLIGAAAPAVRSMMVAPVEISGDYVEARTASVFAGACHYNGERVTEGRSAVMAWSIAGGSFHGTNLAGVKVLAAVVCDDNLAEASADRKSEFVVDAGTDAQANAAVAWVKSRCADQLGSVLSMSREAIAFHRDADAFTVTAKDFAAMSVQPMPNRECCKQPNLVWYQPLMPIDNRRVGYTLSAEYDAAHAGDPWQRTDENSAFYGSFHG